MSLPPPPLPITREARPWHEVCSNAVLPEHARKPQHMIVLMFQILVGLVVAAIALESVLAVKRAWMRRYRATHSEVEHRTETAVDAACGPGERRG